MTVIKWKDRVQFEKHQARLQKKGVKNENAATDR